MLSGQVLSKVYENQQTAFVALLRAKLNSLSFGRFALFKKCPKFSYLNFTVKSAVQ
jgi:hypothetical protein